ncbi:MAG: hypothetical protein EPN92_12400 [Chitinophagaceae bacterium]|nr:MAG: hypothetical protein EPN92_12400 [Chitinophagaceae bacterium]
MYTFALLELGCHYLIQEKEEDPIELIKVTVETDHCLFVSKYDEPTVTEWKRKTDSIHDIIECLTDDSVKEWEKFYNSNQDAYYEEDDDD